MNSSRFKHIFFDLDRTLWDFESNSREELHAIYDSFNLKSKGIEYPMEFIKVYKAFNDACWDEYVKGTLGKEELRTKRFLDTLTYFGISDTSLAEAIGNRYVSHSPYRTVLIPDAIPVLDYLKQKGYHLHIITNGFEEVQHIKLQESKLRPFFDVVITSEMAQAKKPSKVIFDMALQTTGAAIEEVVYVGDDLNIDIAGGISAGWEVIFYNPHGISHHLRTFSDISRLSELKNIL
jgi:putative hydrolase of the HAD superfamily